MFKKFTKSAVFLAALTVPIAAQSAISTVGPDDVDDGWATSITYEDDNAVARRGVENDRDNPLNALGAADGKFFEIGFGSAVDLTFGRDFRSDLTVFEITFGDATTYPEYIDILVSAAGGAGPFEFVQRVRNNAAASGVSVLLTGLSQTLYDTVRLRDASPPTSSHESDSAGPLGGFDVDAVQVNIIPLPAGGLLLLSALGAFGIARRKKNAA